MLGKSDKEINLTVDSQNIQLVIQRIHVYTGFDGVDGLYRGTPESQAVPSELGRVIHGVLILDNGLTYTNTISFQGNLEEFPRRLADDIMRARLIEQAVNDLNRSIEGNKRRIEIRAAIVSKMEQWELAVNGVLNLINAHS